MKTTCLFAAKATRVLSVCFLALLIGGATIARALDREAGVYFTTIVPRGEFSENVTNNGYGVSGQFLVRLAGSPCQLCEKNRTMPGKSGSLTRLGMVSEEETCASNHP